MKNQCSIVKDLLPLYAEELTSQDTGEFVREHLEGCEDCRNELEEIKKPSAITAETNIEPIKKIRKALTANKIRAIALTAIFVLMAAVAVFAYISAPEYLPYSEETIFVTENPNGTVTVTLPGKATDYRCSMTEFEGAEEYSIESWTSILESSIPSWGIRSVTIEPKEGKDTVIRYVQNNGQDDVVLYSDAPYSTGGVITLPRLVLNSYLFIAAVMLTVLLILRIVLRKKEGAKQLLEKLILLPVSYITGHFLVGAGGISYSPQRDFALTILASMLIFSALLLVRSLIRKKEN